MPRHAGLHRIVLDYVFLFCPYNFSLVPELRPRHKQLHLISSWLKGKKPLLSAEHLQLTASFSSVWRTVYSSHRRFGGAASLLLSHFWLLAVEVAQFTFIFCSSSSPSFCILCLKSSCQSTMGRHVAFCFILLIRWQWALLFWWLVHELTFHPVSNY